jgi:transglutaminase-like putative cysteine protease
MIEALRRLGFASRFVSGYLYDAALDGGAVGMTGSGATHAWVQVFLPGAGWIDYDPTNEINSGYDLIPVAVARHPGQAIPLAGSWFGDAKAYQGHVSQGGRPQDRGSSRSVRGLEHAGREITVLA